MRCELQKAARRIPKEMSNTPEFTSTFMHSLPKLVCDRKDFVEIQVTLVKADGHLKKSPRRIPTRLAVPCLNIHYRRVFRVSVSYCV